MNESTRSRQCLRENHATLVMKQEIDDENETDCKKPFALDPTHNTPCTSALKCEYDPDCGCPQCRFNANRIIKREEGDDCRGNTSATQFWTKCVKKEEGSDDDYCGCVECKGVEDSKQSNQIKTNLSADKQSAQSPSIEQNKSQDFDELDDISDCPTPDYLPPFFSEDEDEDDEQEDDDEDEQIDEEKGNENKDDNDSVDTNRQYSRRWSDRVANKPKITYTYREESDNDSDFELSNEDDDTESESEIVDKTSIQKSNQSRKAIQQKQSNKKFKSSHSNDKSPNESSSEETLDASQVPKQKKNRGKYDLKILTLQLNCSECDKTVKDFRTLYKHWLNRHKILRFRCCVRGCSVSFDSGEKFQRHRKDAHGDLTNNWPCGQCNRKLSNYKHLNCHVWKMHQEGHFRCGFKGCRFESQGTRTGVINHFMVNHREKTFACQFAGCGRTFTVKSKLTSHTKVHTKEKPYKCDHCESAFPHKQTLTAHLARKHQIGKCIQYKCKWPKCKRILANQDNTVVHIRNVHFKDADDKRDPKDFYTKIESTSKPKVINDKPKVFIVMRLNCPVDQCSEHFPDKGKLNIHLSKCHQIEQYRCIVRGCMKSFINCGQFTDHKKEAHKNVTLWHCSKCHYKGKTFKLLQFHNFHNHEEGHFGCGHSGCSFVSRTNRVAVLNHRYKHRK